MKGLISKALTDSADLKASMAKSEPLLADIEKALKILSQAVKSGGTIVSCGNGGSACDAMHFTEELVARYKKTRPGIRARHLLDAGILTCWGNDYEFDTVFARQVETICGQNDVLVLISTSGNSKNMVLAAEAAKLVGAKTLGLLGKGGGELAKLCDCSVIVPSAETERIQEAHIALIHIFCEALES